jgi:hypothetical protein
MPFKVKTVESVLQEKKTNLFSKLKTDYGITETQIEGVDMMMKTSDHKSSLTQFASTHLGGVDRDRVDFKGLSARFVTYLGVPEGKFEGCCQLIESYLHCFASFVV